MREFVHHIHMVGIGGAGMGGIAEVLIQQGYIVSGSDLGDNAVTQRLTKMGARISQGHATENIGDADVVVVSSAIADNNVEAVAARASGVPVIPRAEMLGELMRFGHGIAIAGTHGKTTTTSLVAAILAEAGLDPTFIVGGLVNSVASNARHGKGGYLVAEADESDASFLHLQPLLAVVTNIDADHMETYQDDFQVLERAFEDFLHNLPFYGLAILCMDDPVVQRLSERLHRQVISYGSTEGVAFRALNITQNGTNMLFDLERPGTDKHMEVTLSLPGFHNVLNATAAIAVAHQLKVPDHAIVKALREFSGIGRRMQRYGEVSIEDGPVFELVDDYAHHPRELDATLKAARGAWPERRLVPVFQPHRFSRTQNLFDDFVELLADVDPLIITEVYPAGELPISGADGRALCRSIRKRGKTDPIFVESVSNLKEVLETVVQEGDLVLTLGAGDIGRAAQNLATNNQSGVGE